MTDTLTFKSFIGAEAKLRDAGIDDDSQVEITGAILLDFVRFAAIVEDQFRLYAFGVVPGPEGAKKIESALVKLQNSFGITPEAPEQERTFSPSILGN